MICDGTGQLTMEGKAMSELIHKDLTGRIIGVYYQVYNRLSQTYPERIYERAMILLLERLGVTCIQQDEYEIFYKDRLVGVQRLDIFVADQVVVELKVAPEITPLHLAQLLSYLRTVQKEVGLLLRFGGPKPEFVRRVLTRPLWNDTLDSETPPLTERTDLLYPQLSYEIVKATLEVFRILGPGFIHRIYANACYQELKQRGQEVKFHDEFQVFMNDHNLGSIPFGHIQIDNRVLLFPVAISNMEDIRIDNLKVWMRHLDIRLGVLVNFKTTHLKPVFLIA